MNFLIWGGLHVIYLGVERFFIRKFQIESIISDVRPFWKSITILFYSGFTFFLVTCFWVFFRAPNFSLACSIFKGIFTLQNGIHPGYTVELQFYLIVFLVSMAHAIGYFQADRIRKVFENTSMNWQFGLYAFFAIMAVLYSGELKPFIYFVF